MPLCEVCEAANAIVVVEYTNEEGEVEEKKACGRCHDELDEQHKDLKVTEDIEEDEEDE